MPLKDFRPFIREIKDKHAQENWAKLKIYLDQMNAGIGNIINQTITNISNSLWSNKTKQVSSGATSVLIDSIPTSAFCSVEYIICVSNNSGTKKMRLKLSASKDDNGVTDQVYGKSGTYINITLNSIINGSDYELLCDNNEAFAVDIKLTKLVIA